MSKYLRFCTNCHSQDPEYHHTIRGRYSTYLEDDNYTCEVCGEIVKDLSILSDDYKIIVNISNDPQFIKSMIELHDTDIIEYNLKLSQFKAQLNQQESSNIPKCPTCGSTNLSKISTVKKATKIGLFGIFGAGDIGKTYKCNNCSSRF